jgi:hypothetical protein
MNNNIYLFLFWFSGQFLFSDPSSLIGLETISKPVLQKISLERIHQEQLQFASEKKKFSLLKKIGYFGIVALLGGAYFFKRTPSKAIVEKIDDIQVEFTRYRDRTIRDDFIYFVFRQGIIFPLVLTGTIMAANSVKDEWFPQLLLQCGSPRLLLKRAMIWLENGYANLLRAVLVNNRKDVFKNEEWNSFIILAHNAFIQYTELYIARFLVQLIDNKEHFELQEQGLFFAQKYLTLITECSELLGQQLDQKKIESGPALTEIFEQIAEVQRALQEITTKFGLSA